MKIIKNEQVIENMKRPYDEYYKYQAVVELIKDEIIELLVNGTNILSYTAKFVNCHFNLVIEDKGVKRDFTTIELLDSQIAELERQKAEEEAKEN